MRRFGFFSLACCFFFSSPVVARVRHPDLFTLYDVARNARIVVEGTVLSVDPGKHVVALKVEHLYHGQMPKEPGALTEDGKAIRYEVRGSLDAYRPGKRLIEFLDPNLPYGTQDPKTIRAPLKPRSPRNRVDLSDPESKEYADFVLHYLDLTKSDRGAKFQRLILDHLVAALQSNDDRTRKAAGDSLKDLLLLSNREGKLPRELLTKADRKVIRAIIGRADSQAGPGLMKLLAKLGEQSLAVSVVHGVLYLPQAGVKTEEGIRDSLALAPKETAKAIRTEYSQSKTDQHREELISVMGKLAGVAGEAFLWEKLTAERNPVLRTEALMAFTCLPGTTWQRLLPIYRKEPVAGRLNLFRRILSCHPADAKAVALAGKELKSGSDPIRNAAAFELARRKKAEALPRLRTILEGCKHTDQLSLDCLSAMDALRAVGTPEAIAIIKAAKSDETASKAFREDAGRFLEDLSL